MVIGEKVPKRRRRTATATPCIGNKVDASTATTIVIVIVIIIEDVMLFVVINSTLVWKLSRFLYDTNAKEKERVWQWT